MAGTFLMFRTVEAFSSGAEYCKIYLYFVFFRAMFMSGLSESKQSHVHLRNVDPITLQTIIVYAYTGNLEITHSTVELLYETACFLQVKNTHLLSQ